MDVVGLFEEVEEERVQVSHVVPCRVHEYTRLHAQVAGKLCLVCANDAGRHSYYGGQVCNSCRAFFRRAVVGNSHADFRCLDGGGDGCLINSKNRKSCQHCRFTACLRAGMQPKWIMTDSEARVRRERRVVKHRANRREEEERHGNWDPREAAGMGEVFTAEELAEVQELTRRTLEQAHRQQAKFYAR
jgi:hypothetical protein